MTYQMINLSAHTPNYLFSYWYGHVFVNTKTMTLTSGGKTFSAARRGIEKPPWVLVSLAVKVLQKYMLGCLLWEAASGVKKGSFSCCDYQPNHGVESISCRLNDRTRTINTSIPLKNNEIILAAVGLPQ